VLLVGQCTHGGLALQLVQLALVPRHGLVVRGQVLEPQRARKCAQLRVARPGAAHTPYPLALVFCSRVTTSRRESIRPARSKREPTCATSGRDGQRHSAQQHRLHQQLASA
jgi:hypothetical protein